MHVRHVVGRLLRLGLLAMPALAAPPAVAHEGLCPVAGIMTLATGFYNVGPMPVGGPAKSTSFSFSALSCAGPPGTVYGLGASGTITGNCGAASATGAFSGHSFSASVVGNTMTFSGNVTGTLHIVPDSSAGQSCLGAGPGATRFLVEGALTLVPHPPTPCEFDAVMTLSTGIYFNLTSPFGGPSRTASFHASGTCIPDTSTTIPGTATGNMTGWCGDATGSGSLNGRPFDMAYTGNTMTFTGGVIGTLHAEPDVSSGQSCAGTGPGATRLLVTGTLVIQ